MINRINLGSYKGKPYIYDVEKQQIMVAYDENGRSKYIVSAQSIYVLSLIILYVLKNSFKFEGRMLEVINILLISLIVSAAACYSTMQLLKKPDYRAVNPEPDSLKCFVENLIENNRKIIKARVLTLVLSIALFVVYLLNNSFVILIVYATSLYYLVLSLLINLTKRRELADYLQSRVKGR